jgi:two-component system OmpR family sensor kinase
MVHAPRSRLVFRLYAISVVQLLLVAGAGLLIGLLVFRHSFAHDLQALAAALAPLTESPAQLRAELARRLEQDRVSITIYEQDGQLLASNVAPPLPAPRLGAEPPPLPPPPGLFSGPPLLPGAGHGQPARAGSGEPQPHGPPPPFETFTRFPIGAREGLLVVRFGPPRRGALAPLLTLAAALVVFGVGAFLTAKWIARPLDRLATTARALGRGDLQARAALDRNDELGELGGAFDEMAGRIVELLLAEKELLANVSHELRTPLARIRVALEIAAEGDAEAARASLFEIALDLSEIEALIDDILTATRMELAAGKAETAGFALHRKPTAPASIAERAAQRFRACHPVRTLLLESAADLPGIEADAGLLRRALDNLLENAHKYSPDAAQPITLRLSRREQAMCFEVEDRGLGVPEEDLPRLFTAFFRGERSRSRGTGGVGLGLTLAKRIVEAHGGTITVESERGSGTLVRVVLPVGEVELSA